MKIEIRNRFQPGRVIYTAEVLVGPEPLPPFQGQAIKMAVASATPLGEASLIDVDLRDLDLSDAQLEHANLTGATCDRTKFIDASLSRATLYHSACRGADLTHADLTGADLRRSKGLTANQLSVASLETIKNDFWAVLVRAIPEIPALREAIVKGSINGSTYTGRCRCLMGTIAAARNCPVSAVNPVAHRPAERIFLGIGVGDTPEINPVSALVLKWLDEFVSLIPAPSKSGNC